MEKAKTVINNLEPKQHSELAAMVLDKTRVIPRDQTDILNELKLVATAYHHLVSFYSYPLVHFNFLGILE